MQFGGPWIFSMRKRWWHGIISSQDQLQGDLKTHRFLPFDNNLRVASANVFAISVGDVVVAGCESAGIRHDECAKCRHWGLILKPTILLSSERALWWWPPHHETTIVRLPLKWSTQLSFGLELLVVNALPQSGEVGSENLARAVGSEPNRIFQTHYGMTFGASRNPGR